MNGEPSSMAGCEGTSVCCEAVCIIPVGKGEGRW